MRVFQTLGFTALILLGIAGLVVDIGYGFFLALDKTKTVDTYYIDNQTPVDVKELKDAGKLTDDQVDELESRKLFEVNLYSNVDTKKNNEKTGIVLEELKLNHFTDPSLSVSSIVSSGMQYVSDYDGKEGLYTSQGAYVVENNANTGDNVQALIGGDFDVLGKVLNCRWKSSAQMNFATESEANDYVSESFNYYESVNFGVTWNAKGLQTQLNRKTEFIIKIGDGDDAEAYKIRLDKYLDTRYDNRPSVTVPVINWKVSTTWLPWNWHKANDYGGQVEYYNWDMVFEDIMHAVLTNNMQTGTHYGAVNLTKYFTVTEHFNKDSKKWEQASDADQQVTYAVVKFNYHTKGAISNKQSMFGIIADDPRFKLGEVNYDTDYGQSNVVYELTTDSLAKRYSDAYNGYFLSLSIDLQRQLRAMPPYYINLTIDLNKKYKGKQIVGLDVNAFDGFELNKLTIKGNSQTFYLLNNSLRNTNLASVDIAKTVTLVNVESGVEL